VDGGQALELRYERPGKETMRILGDVLAISGPGVESEHRLAVRGMDRRYAEALREVNELFPVGLDCCLLDPGGRLVCLPRSSRVEVR
jgi:alpha-D-ribose 1-methylphosphonate 5-triphosphate synthase subunit PhnH